MPITTPTFSSGTAMVTEAPPARGGGGPMPMPPMPPMCSMCGAEAPSAAAPGPMPGWCCGPPNCCCCDMTGALGLYRWLYDRLASVSRW